MDVEQYIAKDEERILTELSDKKKKALTDGSRTEASTNALEVQNSAQIEEAKEKQKAQELAAQYNTKSGRLVKFQYQDGSIDNDKRAYLKLVGEEPGLTDLTNSAADTNLKSILNLLKGKYTSFILLNLSNNYQEKQQVMPTVGDSFAATFSGKEPQVIDISGMLPFDSTITYVNDSWYIMFVKAFTNYIRASVLAKYHCQLKLVLPDFQEILCYPISFNANLTSSQDTLIQFSMGAIVVDSKPINAYGLNADVSLPQTQGEELMQMRINDMVKQASAENNSPLDVGKESSKKTFVDQVNDFLNTCATGEGTNELAKGINFANKTIATMTQVTGAFNTLSGKPYGSRTVRGN